MIAWFWMIGFGRWLKRAMHIEERRPGAEVSVIPAIVLALALSAVSPATTESDSGGITGQTPLIVEVWTLLEGLPQSSVNDILQTRDGYLWLATYGGLVRFDGARFQVFDTAGTQGLADDRFLCLFEADDGALWVGMQESGLVRYQNGQFRSYGAREGLPRCNVNDIAQAESGGLWLMTTAGLIRFYDDQARVVTVMDRRVSHSFVRADGAIWMSSQDVVIHYRDGETRLLTETDGLPDHGVLDVHEDQQGVLWIATNGGVYRWLGTGCESFLLEGGLPLRVFTISDDRAGGLWLAAERQGLIHIDSRGTITVIEYESLIAASTGLKAAPTVNDLYVDRERSIWLGTNQSGLIRLRPRLINRFTIHDGLPGRSTRAVVGDGAGSVWVGVDCGSMAHIHGQEVQPVQLSGGPGLGCVTSLMRTRQGALWIAHGGIFSVVDRGIQIDHDLRRDLGIGGAYALFEDSAGIIWIGTDQGLLRYDGEVFSRISSSGLASRDVKFITEDRSGALWFGTTHGAGCLRSGSLTELTTAEGLSPGRVRAILEDRSGTIWFGTYGGGLSRLKDGRITRLSTDDGLIDNFISAIVEDDDDNLWISSNHGLSVLSRTMLEDVADGAIERLNPVWYGIADGSAEANGGSQSSAWLDPSDGKLWFTTVDGLAVIDTARRPHNPVPPPVVIEKVVVDGTRVDHQAEVRIHPGARDFEIGYSALSLLRPRHVRFKYRLLGYNDRWTDAGNRRTAYFTHVPPGDYRFQVIACNDDGIWNENGAELSVVKLPRFSETVWLPLLIVLALVGTGYSAHRFRVRAMQRLNLELEQRVYERTAQLEEANQELEAFVYSVSHDLQKPLRWIDGFGNILTTSHADRLDDEGQELLSRIRAAARRMSALIDDLLTLSRVSRGELRREDIDLGHLAQEIIDEQHRAEPKREVRISIATGLLVHADPRLVRVMLENLISNAWKYTGRCRQAAIELGRQASDDPVYFVRDNGVGFDMAYADKLFRPFQRLHSSEEFAGTGVGLATVQRIVARHKGRVWANADVGKGATFFFSLGEQPQPPANNRAVQR